MKSNSPYYQGNEVILNYLLIKLPTIKLVPTKGKTLINSILNQPVKMSDRLMGITLTQPVY